VISLFGFDEPPASDVARFELIDGMVHCISLAAGGRLRMLGDHYEMIWATGWARPTASSTSSPRATARCGRW
jgi:hypothetical protein